jgi:hypothetical protein
MAKFQVTAEQINRELVISFCDTSNIQQKALDNLDWEFGVWLVLGILTYFTAPVFLFFVIPLSCFSLVWRLLKGEKFITQLVLNKSQNTATEYFWRKGQHSTRVLEVFNLANMDSCNYKVYSHMEDTGYGWKFFHFFNSHNPKEKYMYRLPGDPSLVSYNKDIITTIDAYLKNN